MCLLGNSESWQVDKTNHHKLGPQNGGTEKCYGSLRGGVWGEVLRLLRISPWKRLCTSVLILSLGSLPLRCECLLCSRCHLPPSPEPQFMGPTTLALNPLDSWVTPTLPLLYKHPLSDALLPWHKKTNTEVIEVSIIVRCSTHLNLNVSSCEEKVLHSCTLFLPVSDAVHISSPRGTMHFYVWTIDSQWTIIVQ